MIARAVAIAWIALILGGLAVGLSGSARARDALLDDGPGCLFKATTGVDCAFCGMTHATIALGSGDWSGAHHFHPLAALVLVGQLAALGLIAAGRTDLLMRGRTPLLVLGAIAAIWAVKLLV